MSGKAPLYYWDSCLFLAWLKDETTRKPGEMDGVREFVDKLRKGQISIITSTMTYVEVTTAKLPIGVTTLLEDVFKKRNLQKIAVDIKIAKLARDLRDYYSLRASEHNNKTLSSPDAVHLATAILYKVDEFHTFDEKNRNGTLGLIPLSGDVGGHSLIICKPVAKQPGLNIK